MFNLICMYVWGIMKFLGYWSSFVITLVLLLSYLLCIAKVTFIRQFKENLHRCIISNQKLRNFFLMSSPFGILCLSFQTLYLL